MDESRLSLTDVPYDTPRYTIAHICTAGRMPVQPPLRRLALEASSSACVLADCKTRMARQAEDYLRNLAGGTLEPALPSEFESDDDAPYIPAHELTRCTSCNDAISIKCAAHPFSLHSNGLATARSLCLIGFLQQPRVRVCRSRRWSSSASVELP